MLKGGGGNIRWQCHSHSDELFPYILSLEAVRYFRCHLTAMSLTVATTGIAPVEGEVQSSVGETQWYGGNQRLWAIVRALDEEMEH